MVLPDAAEVSPGGRVTTSSRAVRVVVLRPGERVDEVAAKIDRVGIPFHVSSESGSGMNPSMLITQMKSISEATYGNQRLIAFVGSPCSATCTCAIS